jgi:poly [ADP-ribose] polymerase 2/3/4
MNKQMIQIGYNVKKMPLGRLHNDTIKKGYNILQKLMDELKGKNKIENI